LKINSKYLGKLNENVPFSHANRREDLTVEDLAYAAAALECEGSITLSRAITPKGHSMCSIVISIANTNQNLVTWLQQTFGYGAIYREEPKRLSKRPIYRWKLAATKALDFLLSVRPYMKMKCAQADLAIEFQQDRNDHKRTREVNDSYWLRMKSLNRGESPAETKRVDAETNLRSDSPILEKTPVLDTLTLMASLSDCPTSPN
jgi:hypothetical protein